MNCPGLAAYNSFKNPNALNVAPSETVAGLPGGAEQINTRNNPYSFPSGSQTTAIVGKAGQPPIAESSPQQTGTQQQPAVNPAGYQVPSYAYQQYGRNRN